MDNIKKYRFYADLAEDGNCAFYIAEIPETAVSISSEVHQKLLEGLNLGN